MSANVASFRDYKPSRLRQQLEQTAPQNASIISDMADGILVTEAFFTHAGFDYGATQLVLTIIGIIGDGADSVELYDEQIAEVANCNERTVRRWRKEYQEQAAKLNFSPLIVAEGEYCKDKLRYLPTSYRITFAETLEQSVTTARASVEYRTDRVKALTKAAHLFYEEIESAPLPKRRRKPKPAPKTPIAYLHGAQKKIVDSRKLLTDMSDRQRAAFVNGQGEELYATLDAIRNQVAELEAILTAFPATVENTDVDDMPDILSGIPPRQETDGDRVRVKEERTRTAIEPEREYLPEDVAAFDSIIERARGRGVKHADIEIHAASDPTAELSYELDPDEAAERAAIQAEGCELTIELSPPRYEPDELLYPCTAEGVLLHDAPSPVAEARQTPAGAWQYRLKDFTEWRDEDLLTRPITT
jgi:hypothetical protein